jgi:acetyltransferase-like isoleucine patch superfamily enzyme
MTRLLLIGSDPLLEPALDAAAFGSAAYTPMVLRLPPYSGKPPSLDELSGHSASDTLVFVAAGPDYLNLLRRRLFDIVRTRGFRLATLVHSGAVLSGRATLGENAWVGAGSVVEAQASVGANSIVAAGAFVGAGARVGESSWIGPGAVVEPGATIGSHSVLAGGVRIAAGVSVGSWCEIAKPGCYQDALPDRCFVHPLFDDVVSISG